MVAFMRMCRTLFCLHFSPKILVGRAIGKELNMCNAIADAVTVAHRERGYWVEAYADCNHERKELITKAVQPCA